jgi:transposase
MRSIKAQRRKERIVAHLPTCIQGSRSPWDAHFNNSMRIRLEPMKKMARMLRAHQPLLMNWFRVRGELSSAAVEGLNNKCRVITRRSYGFRTYNGIEVALYHTLGRLPEPETTHRFC